MMGSYSFETAWGMASIECDERGITSFVLPTKDRSLKIDSLLKTQNTPSPLMGEGGGEGENNDDPDNVSGVSKDTVPGVDNAIRASRLLQRYFDGEKVDFNSVKVNIDGFSPFFRKVCQVVRDIPYGSVASYKDVAAKAGKKNGARAVGRVMAKNPVPVIIPCHRVVASDGRLTGYSAAGGVGTKDVLLRMEGALCVNIGETSAL